MENEKKEVEEVVVENKIESEVEHECTCGECDCDSRPDMSEELYDIMYSLQNYVAKHDGMANVSVSVMAFEGPEFNVVDERIFMFGLKDNLIMEAEDRINRMKEDTENEFINNFCFNDDDDNIVLAPEDESEQEEVAQTEDDK